MRKRPVVAAAVALLLALLVVRLQCRSDDAKSAVGSANATKRATAGAASQHIDEVPPWLAQLDVGPRKIAGKVLFAGKPVEGAVVHLALDAGNGWLQPLAVARTGPEGVFDFGLRPAAFFNVSAEAPGRKPAQLSVALADPNAKPDQLVLELGECSSRLYGSVLDASGGAISKAKISVAGLAGAESDAKGEYVVCMRPGIEPRNQIVRVEADGYGTIAVIVGFSGDLPHDFVLVPEAVLVGQVVTVDKQPVTRARVIALPNPTRIPSHPTSFPHDMVSGWAISGDDGRFRIPGLLPGPYRLLATADGLTTKTPVDALARTGTTTRDAIIVVTTAARVRGHVMMAGKPVVGATVSAMLDSGGSRLPWQDVSVSAKSQEDGSFTLQGVPLGKISFSVVPYQVLSPRLLDVSTAPVDDVKIEVAALASIHGTITRKGKPVTDGVVEAPPQISPVNAGRSGQYRVEGLQPGEFDLVALSPESNAFAVVKSVQVAAGEDKLVDIELDRAGSVTGVVVDESGKPVPSVYIRLVNNDGDMGESMTNARGEFDAGSMSGGDYRASVYPSPMAQQPFELATGAETIIKVPQDGVVTGIQIQIKHDTFTISGAVVDDAGGPVADVRIEAIGRGEQGNDPRWYMSEPASIMTTGDGMFRFTNLARGTYDLHAHAFDGSEGDAFDIAAGSENVQVKLVRTGTLEGNLVGFSTTPAIMVHTLTMGPVSGGLPIVEGTHFLQTGLRPGSYTVEARAGAESVNKSVEIKSGQTTTVTLTSGGMATVEGNLFEFGTKAPLPGYRCVAHLSMGGVMGAPLDSQASSDRSGHFAMDVPSGTTVRVYCFAQTNASDTPAGADVSVVANATARVELYGVRMKSGSAGDAGIKIEPFTLPLTINAVEPNSAAAKKGITVGDRVVTIDGASLQGLLPEGAMALVGNHAAGSTLSIGVDRSGTVTTYELPVLASPN